MTALVAVLLRSNQTELTGVSAECAVLVMINEDRNHLDIVNLKTVVYMSLLCCVLLISW